MQANQTIELVPGLTGQTSPHHTVRIAGVGMFALLLATYSLNAMDRQIFPLLLSNVRQDYGFSLANGGLLSTVFTFGMACAGLPTGWMMARLSRRATVQIGILIFSITTILTALAPGFWTMTLWRGLTGVGEAMQLTALLAIAGSYFTQHHALAVGAINTSFGIGAIIGPALGAFILAAWGSWHAPMFVFGAMGLVAVLSIAVFVRPWLSEATTAWPSGRDETRGGAESLLNRDTILLSILSLIGGLIIYGYLGMYPSFLRVQLGYSPQEAGNVMAFFGLGVLASVAGGAIGDRVPGRLLLACAFLGGGVIGFGLFHGLSSFTAQAGLSFLWGLVVSGTIYVNLAAYHVKAVVPRLAAKSSGLFVTVLYGSSSVAGYIFGGLADLVGWTRAADLQILCLCLLGALLSMGLSIKRAP